MGEDQIQTTKSPDPLGIRAVRNGWLRGRDTPSRKALWLGRRRLANRGSGALWSRVLGPDLAKGDVGGGGEDDGAANPGPNVRDLPEGGVPDNCDPDQPGEIEGQKTAVTLASLKAWVKVRWLRLPKRDRWRSAKANAAEGARPLLVYDRTSP